MVVFPAFRGGIDNAVLRKRGYRRRIVEIVNSLIVNAVTIWIGISLNPKNIDLPTLVAPIASQIADRDRRSQRELTYGQGELLWLFAAGSYIGCFVCKCNL